MRRESKALEDLVILKDITENKRIEKAFKESEQKYRSLVKHMNEGLAQIDENNRLTLANPKFCEMLKYSEEEIIGKDVSLLFDNENRKILNRELTKRRKGESSHYEITFTTKTDEKIPVLMSAAPLIKEGVRRGSYAAVTNLTERNQLENIYRTLASNSQIGVYIVQENRFRFVDPKIQEYLGFSEDELLVSSP